MEIKLPEPKIKGEMSLEEAIYRRKSIRRYTSEPLTLSELSQVLWA
ncbi:nitroreductase, partial [Thermococcus sp. ES12]|nr:nitroreductase [Thermococcus sp. ES12]